MRISDWISDVCSSDLRRSAGPCLGNHAGRTPYQGAGSAAGHVQLRGVGSPQCSDRGCVTMAEGEQAAAGGSQNWLRRNYLPLLTAILLLAVAAIYFYSSFGIRVPPLGDMLGPRSFPVVVGAVDRKSVVGTECVGTCRSRWSPDQ